MVVGVPQSEVVLVWVPSERQQPAVVRVCVTDPQPAGVLQPL